MPLESTAHGAGLADWVAAYLEAHAAEETSSADRVASDADLVRRFQRARGVMRALELTLAHAGVSPSDDQAARDEAPPGYSTPRQIGRYLVLSELGRGGGGIVLRALDPVLGRVIALKLPRPEAVLSRSLRERFLREARALAALRHPHLVEVYEVGSIGCVPYIASAYSPGPDLSDWLARRREPVSARLAAKLVALLAETVEYVHGQGILHRDLKPGNILLDPLPEEGLQRRRGDDDTLPFAPKLTDFGLAKELVDTADRTQTGAILGTPSYMAPEQAEGRLHDMGPATDVHALGAILYELLTRRPPFGSGTTEEILRRIMDGQVAPPRVSRPDVPRDLEAVCLKCLERDPCRRYSSAGELAADLHLFLAGRPVQVRAAGALARLGKWCRRRPLVAALTAACSVALLAGVAGIGWQWRRAEQYRDLAEGSFRQAHEAVRQFQALLDDDRFDDLEFQPLREAILAAAVRYYEDFVRHSAGDPHLRTNLADAHYRIGFIRLDGGPPADALFHLTASLSLWTELARESPDDLQHLYFQSKAHAALGNLHKRSRCYETALTHFQWACEICERLARERPADPGMQNQLADMYQSVAAVCLSLNRRQEYRAFLEQAYQVRQRIPCDEPLARHQLAQTCHALGGLFTRDQDHGSARDYYRQACEILEELVARGERHPWSNKDLATVHLGLATIASESGDGTGAVACLDAAHSIMEPLVQKYPTSVSLAAELAKVCDRLSSLLIEMKRGAEALRYLERARTLREEIAHGPAASAAYRRDLAKTYGNLGRAHAAAGFPAEAAQWHRREIDTLLELLTDDAAPTLLHRDLATAYKRLASRLRDLKLTDESLQATQSSAYHRGMFQEVGSASQ